MCIKQYIFNCIKNRDLNNIFEEIKHENVRKKLLR